MENLNDREFFVAGWKVLPAQDLLTRDADEVRVEPKVMEVLVYLASRQGEVVSREELERDVWRGALVGYNAVTATVIKLRKALKDDAKQSRIINTVPKRGYQLIAEVKVAEIDNRDSPVSNRVAGTSQPGLKNKSSRWVVAAVFACVLIAFLFTTQSTKQSPEITPSVIVLPIENRDHNNKYDTFLDGITEDLITDLSRIANLTVFASATSFKYRGQQPTPQNLRQELNVDFVLAGNARHEGKNIRINIQLSDAKDGRNVWARRYDRKVVDVFTVQDEITSSVIEALAIKLSASEKKNLAERSTNNLEAYQHFLEGQRISRQQTKQANAQAREAYRRAIELDPTYGRAYGALAYTLALDYRHGWTDTPLQNLDRALELAEKGITFDDSIPQTFWSLGYVHLRRKDYEKALQAAEDSIRVSPSYADGYGLLALINNGLGRPEKALAYAKRGMQLNPYYTWDYLFNVGWAHYMLGDYQQALQVLEQAQARNEEALPPKLALAVTYISLGRVDDAQWMIDQIRALNPATTIEHLSTASSLVEPRLKEKYLNDLRKAGLPEQ